MYLAQHELESANIMIITMIIIIMCIFIFILILIIVMIMIMIMIIVIIDVGSACRKTEVGGTYRAAVWKRDLVSMLPRCTPNSSRLDSSRLLNTIPLATPVCFLFRACNHQFQLKF